MTAKEKIKEQINKLLGSTPEYAMDPPYTKRCKEYAGDDPVLFVRNLQDELVYTSGCADLIIALIDVMLKPFPAETEAEAETRREKLQSALD